ncbi:type III secretion protein Q [Pseudomonas sp. F-14 TE3623]|uniref:FliM/FliN family flagellar motor switch protein n=1 Tax=Pseudomonas farris TaxID=2841207 RepID=A0ABS6PWS5_9PSED|nr:FliM/FliN family flagellar motor switch protein [Pseudomonas farris]MBV4464933.1 FliM/FliN family flagellar motor switch protein [Pseudomonas farris]
MSVRTLSFRAMPADEALARQRVGQGLSLRFRLEQASGSLNLRLAPTPFGRTPGRVLASESGALWLSDATALLGLLSSCPALLPETASEDPDDAWYWQLYNHYLSPELQTLFGHLQPTVTVVEGAMECLLEAQINGLRVYSRVRLLPATLLGLLGQGGWEPRQSSMQADWLVILPLLLGRTELSSSQTASLRPGDILLPEHPLFAPDGQGTLHIGGCRLGLRQDETNPLRFSITDLEENLMNASIDNLAAVDALATLDPELPELNDARQADDRLARFADLPLALTLRAGSLSLTLGQMSTLAVGSVLTFSGCAPGNATLCHGERPLAHGELVDVEGRLGLQITRLETQR